jgi:adenine deaminase
MQIIGQLVDILQRTIYPAVVTIEAGRIQSITPLSVTSSADAAEPAPILLPDNAPYILPGFIDAHVHIESSLLIPSEFARIAVTHGTVATVSDPHEIANVCGLPGVEFMIRNGNSVPFHFNFGAPSCVPATRFETAGATLEAAKVAQLLARDDIKYLSEMMNFPGVLGKDPEVMAKLHAAQRLGKPIDGHAPGLRGEQAKQYVEAGISTDHECFMAEEALDKLRLGMQILIREGSAARNFDALIPLLNDWPNQMMFCTDDCHPDYLLTGHINRLCARAVAAGIDVFKVLRAACVNPVIHYRLDTGLLRPGHSADLVLVEDLVSFKVIQTIIRGQVVAQDGVTSIPSISPALAAEALAKAAINNFNCNPHTPEDFAYTLNKWGEEENFEQAWVIEALDGQLITNKLLVPVADCLPSGGDLHSNPEKDILKIVVVNRYQPNRPVAKSFIRNFGLRRGAIASSVAHDSHNIVAIGVDDESLCRAINLIIAQQGGLSCVDPGSSGSAAPGSIPSDPAELILPLPVAGLMSLDEGHAVAEKYIAIDRLAKNLGSSLRAPFMTLSFMALLVIPHMKLSDLGLFDGDGFVLL